MFTLLSRKMHKMREMAPVRRNDWGLRRMHSYRMAVGPRRIVNVVPEPIYS